MKLEGIDHVALSVSDVDRSVAWYQEVLGLERRYDEAWGNHPAFVGIGTTALALFPATSAQSKQTRGRDRISMRHLAFRADRANFEKAQVFLMTKVCTHGRGRAEAMKQLDQSLHRLRTDHLDLWQVHEVIYDNDPDLHFAAGGVIEALEEARRLGKVRFIGFTGHKDPAVHLKMLERRYAFDSCQLPLNCFDGSFRSFEQQVLPELNRQGIAALGMKSMGGRGEPVARGIVSPSEALRYALSLPVASVVSGIDSSKVLRQNLDIARKFSPMSEEEMKSLRQRCASSAVDGRFELYKTSKMHDGPVGRSQHGFPPPGALGL